MCFHRKRFTNLFSRFPDSQIVTDTAPSHVFTQWHFAVLLPAYSDRIAQAFHLIPFYLHGFFFHPLRTEKSLISFVTDYSKAILESQTKGQRKAHKSNIFYIPYDNCPPRSMFYEIRPYTPSFSFFPPAVLRASFCPAVLVFFSVLLSRRKPAFFRLRTGTVPRRGKLLCPYTPLYPRRSGFLRHLARNRIVWHGFPAEPPCLRCHTAKNRIAAHILSSKPAFRGKPDHARSSAL